jgi:uncharacterized protein YneF (UPF0154 family)
MNVKTKITFWAIIVLVIGIFIGFMLNRIVVQNRIKEAFSRINPNRLPAFYERVLDPNKDSSSQVRSILSKHAKRVRNIRNDYQKQIQKASQSLYYELAPFLTPVQRKRLSQMLFRPKPPVQWFPPVAENFPIMAALEKDVEFLKEELSLTEEQTVKIRDILIKYRVPLWIPRLKDDSIKNKRYLDILRRAEERDQAVKSELTQKQRRFYDKIRKQIN